MNPVANFEEVMGLVARGAHVYCGHSGGKDSETMYRRLVQLIPHDQLHVVHADLGDIEWAGVKEYITSVIDHPLLIADAIFNDGSAKDFFGMVRQRRVALDRKGEYETSPFPAPGLSRQCTSDLKTGPIWKVIKAHAKEHGITTVINAVGIRGDESGPRQSKVDSSGTLNLNPKQNVQSRTSYDWWPIAHWLTSEVWEFLHANGSQGHPAYADGNERLSCMFCIMGSANDLKHAYRVNPDLAHRYIALEAEVRSTMFYAKGKRVSLADRLGIEIEINPTQGV